MIFHLSLIRVYVPALRVLRPDEALRSFAMEENWSNSTDPKERRKIQNRVAQRAHRMLYCEIMGH